MIDLQFYNQWRNGYTFFNFFRFDIYLEKDDCGTYAFELEIILLGLGIDLLIKKY